MPLNEATSTLTDSPTPSPKRRGITFRAVLLGTLLTPLNAFWVLRMEEVMFGPFPSILSLFANCVFLLVILVGFNHILWRFAPRFAFSQAELLTLYTMLAISTGMAGQSGINIVCGMIGHGAWFSASNGEWGSFLSAFPDWLVIRDTEILRGHFLGNSTLYDVAILRAWMTPVLAWTLLFNLVLLVAYSVNVLIRKQWADHERLTFPIIWLPIEMTEEGKGVAFFKNRWMWAGFIIAGGLNLWNGIAFLYPSVPALPMGIIDLKPLFTSKPWSAIDWTPTTLYPLVIGLSYLLPLDLLFSCWFFYFFWKGQRIVASMMAWDTSPDVPFIPEQGFGCVVGLFLYYLWSGRQRYAEIGRSIMRTFRGEKRDGDDSNTKEGVSERVAVGGIVVGLVGLFLFGLAAKVAWWVTIAFLAMYLPLLVVVTRIRAELGAPIHDFTFMGPDFMLPRLTGIGSLRQTDLAFLSLSYPLTYSRSNDTMPIALESQQMAQRKNMEPGRMLAVIVFSTVIATLSAFWAYEHQAYQLGTAAKWTAGTHFAQESLGRMAGWAGGTKDAQPNTGASLAMGMGLVTTLMLMSLRLRYFGFPLHPIGYALSSAWMINITWLPMLLAWMAKGLILRYGGSRLYRLLLPFFLGLILGDCVMGCSWGLVSLIFNVRTYNFFGA